MGWQPTEHIISGKQCRFELFILPHHKQRKIIEINKNKHDGEILKRK